MAPALSLTAVFAGVLTLAVPAVQFVVDLGFRLLGL